MPAGRRKGGGLAVQDLGSKNVVYVNTTRIPANEPVIIRPGDAVDICGFLFQLLRPGADPSEPRLSDDDQTFSKSMTIDVLGASVPTAYGFSVVGSFLLGFFSAPMASELVYAFGEQLVSDFSQRGLDVAPEIFPGRGISTSRPSGSSKRDSVPIIPTSCVVT